MNKQLKLLVLPLLICFAPALASANTIQVEATNVPGHGTEFVVTGLGSGGTQFFGLGDRGASVDQIGSGAFSIPGLRNSLIGDLWNTLLKKKSPSVPEPGVLSLFAVGAIGLLWVNARRRKRLPRPL